VKRRREAGKSPLPESREERETFIKVGRKKEVKSGIFNRNGRVLSRGKGGKGRRESSVRGETALKGRLEIFRRR